MEKGICLSQRLESSFPCIDCGIDTLPDPNEYSVHDDIWMEAVGCIFPAGWIGHLCLHCLKIRLGRDLQLADFMLECDVNNHINQKLLNKVNS